MVTLPESCCSKKSCGSTVIINISNCMNCVLHFIVHDCIHKNSHWVLRQNLKKIFQIQTSLNYAEEWSLSHTYLLGWYFKSLWPHVNLFININTRNNKEDSRTPCSSSQQSSKSKYYCSLVFLDNLKPQNVLFKFSLSLINYFCI